MKYILLLIFIFPTLLQAAEDTDPNTVFAENYIAQFDFAMPLPEVRNLLLKHQDKIEFFNNCTEQYEFPVSSCDKGYSLVTTIKLPESKSLERGDLQLYFSFNAKQQLMNSYYEIYYTEQHS